MPPAANYFVWASVTTYWQGPVIIVGFVPWTLHLPWAISTVLNRRVGNIHFRELLLAWVVSMLLS